MSGKAMDQMSNAELRALFRNADEDELARLISRLRFQSIRQGWTEASEFYGDPSDPEAKSYYVLDRERDRRYPQPKEPCGTCGGTREVEVEISQTQSIGKPCPDCQPKEERGG